MQREIIGAIGSSNGWIAPSAAAGVAALEAAGNMLIPSMMPPADVNDLPSAEATTCPTVSSPPVIMFMAQRSSTVPGLYPPVLGRVTWIGWLNCSPVASISSRSALTPGGSVSGTSLAGIEVRAIVPVTGASLAPVTLPAGMLSATPGRAGLVTVIGSLVSSVAKSVACATSIRGRMIGCGTTLVTFAYRSCPRNGSSGAISIIRSPAGSCVPSTVIGPSQLAGTSWSVKSPAASVIAVSAPIVTGSPGRGLPASSTTWPETIVDACSPFVMVIGTLSTAVWVPSEAVTVKLSGPCWPGAGANTSTPVPRLKTMLAGNGCGAIV
jgi:hypothetical protein